MNQQESTRAVIVAGLRAGRTVKEIMSFANIKKSTVYDVKKKYYEFIASGGSPDTFKIARKMHKRRSDYKGTALAEDLRELVTKDPGRSMRSIAQEMNVSRTTVRKMVSEDLRYKSYAMRRGQFMSEVTKTRRLEKAKKLLARIKHPSSPILSSSSQTRKTSRRTRK
jgi:transposase